MQARPSSSRDDARPRRARAGVTLGLAALAVNAGPLVAGDRSLTMGLSQTFAGDSNAQLENGDTGGFFSQTNVSFNYADRRPTSIFTLGTSFNYNASTGSDNDNIDGLFPSFRSNYTVSRRTEQLSFSLSGSARPVDFTENVGFELPDAPDPDPDDPGDPDEPPLPEGRVNDNRDRDAIRLFLQGGTNYTQTINSRDSFSLGASFTHLDYTDDDDDGDDLTPSLTLNVNSSLDRRLSERTTTSWIAQGTYFDADNTEDRTTWSFTVRPAVTYEPTPNIRWAASLGPRFSVSYFDEDDGSRESESDWGLRGNLGFRYTKDVETFTAGLTQSVEPDDEGELVNVSSANVGYSRRLSATERFGLNGGATYRSSLNSGGDSQFDDNLVVTTRANYAREINRRSSGDLRVGARWDQDDGDDEERTTLDFGAGYNYALTREVNARLGYTFRWRDEDDEDTQTSHRVFLTLSRGFTLLP